MWRRMALLILDKRFRTWMRRFAWRNVNTGEKTCDNQHHEIEYVGRNAKSN